MEMLEQEVPETKIEQTDGPKAVYSIGVEYPHILTKHNKQHKSDELLFFPTMEQAFAARRKMSPEYSESHRKFMEYEEFHKDDSVVSKQ
jgi:hypothetical protein